MSRYETSEQAEEAFYAAFERRDLEAMMTVFADHESIACIHPMGQLLSGRKAVSEGWRQIFSGEDRMHFQIEQRSHSINESIAVHTVIESIYLHGDSRPRPPIVATNVYQRTADGWRIIVHHASPSVVDVRGRSEEQAPGPLH